jgi:hypothetical protein
MRRLVIRLLACASAALVAPTAAVAASTHAATKPAARPGSLALYLSNVYVVRRQPVTVPGRTVQIDGVVHPYVAGQRVTVEAWLGRHLIKRQRLRIKPGRGLFDGRFSERLSSPGAGQITVQVSHGRTAAQLGFKETREFAALDTQVGFGSTGPFVQLVQQRLAALHFWIPQTGVYDSGTGLAIDAYHRLLHWGVSQNLDGKTISYLLNGWGSFKVRYPGHRRHAEGDLGLQLLALVNGSQVQEIFPISSGKPSTPTVTGSYTVYSKVPGMLPDGMYFSNFFVSGYAIHGYDPAPDYPASHGCMRLPMQDATTVYGWLHLGDGVDVYF